MLKRTQKEIKARYEKRSGEHKFFEGWEYLKFLTYENAHPYLGEGHNEKTWRQTKDDPVKLIKTRGRESASDGVERIMAWLWLAGEDKLLKKVETAKLPDVPEMVSKYFKAKPKTVGFNVKDLEEENESGS